MPTFAPAPRSLADAVGFLQNAAGAVAGPFDAWLTLRGLKTLGVRMERHSANALAVATFLETHPAVTEVLYPGLESHPGHEVASRQMRAFGGMIEADAGYDTALSVAVRVCQHHHPEITTGIQALVERWISAESVH